MSVLEFALSGVKELKGLCSDEKKNAVPLCVIEILCTLIVVLLLLVVSSLDVVSKVRAACFCAQSGVFVNTSFG